MKKRIISLFLVIIMLLCTIPTAFAAVSVGSAKYGKNYKTSVTLSGNLASDIVTIAKAQTGKTKSDLKFTSAWCDAFVIDCARMANVPTSIIPNTRGCKALYDAILNAGGTKVTSPQAGDIVLYYCSICKNYPHIGIYAGSNYVCEGNVSSSVVYSDRTKLYYMDGSGHTSKSTVKMLYVRPNYSGAAVHTLNFNANGGSGSMSSIKAVYGANFSLPKNTFTRTNYTFAGWTAQRSDGKWHCVGQGWKTEAEISANGYTKTVYNDEVSGAFNTSWTTGTTGVCSVTFYAQWNAVSFSANLYENHSGKNYFRFSDFDGSVDSTLYSSRDTSVYTVSYDSGRGNGYGAMKIVGTAAGSSSKDLLWRTSTQGSAAYNGYVGDERSMTMSFWAKSSVSGAKLYIRWGYESATQYRVVTLSNEWRYYTVYMDKTTLCGTDMHPYFDVAGTFWISELQLEDGSTATDFVPENGNLTTLSYTPGVSYTGLTVPTRSGYTFDGWYTAAQGGSLVNEETAVMNGSICLYAHWAKDVPAATFTDVSPTDWFKPYVDFAVSEGLMKGTSDTRFEPNATMTRAMLVTVLYRMEGEPAVGGNVPFTDLAQDWYKSPVAWAYENGIVSGTGGTSFSPDDPITREQMAAILYRYAQHKGYDTSASANLASFPDSADTSSWAVTALSWANAEGLITGSKVGDKTYLDPKGSATRAQVATILMRFCEKY